MKETDPKPSIGVRSLMHRRNVGVFSAKHRRFASAKRRRKIGEKSSHRRKIGVKPAKDRRKIGVMSALLSDHPDERFLIGAAASWWLVAERISPDLKPGQLHACFGSRPPEPDWNRRFDAAGAQCLPLPAGRRRAD
jgi:hypothetical protein